MAKLSEKSKANARFAFAHPVRWLRGEHLEPHNVTPFEMATQLFSKGFNGFMNGFIGKRGFLYTGTDPGKVPPKYTAVTGAISTTWDALNDPMIGSYMDAHPWKTNVHRWIIRASGVLGPMVGAFTLLNLGLSPLTRVISWLVLGVVNETLGTANEVSGNKLRATVTPYLEERRKMQNWANIGRFMGTALSAVPMALLGLRDILGITDYQIFVVGAFVTMPLVLFGNIIPSFVTQRVEFPERGPDEKPMTILQSFAIAKHNGWLLHSIIGNFISAFIPGVDNMYFYRFLVKAPPPIGRLHFNSEMIFTVKNSIVPIPGTFLMVFARKAIKRVGGDKNMVLLTHATRAITLLLRYFVGYKTFPRLMFMYLMEIVEDIPHHWVSVADGTIKYQMYDYVEWKTGVRSEGVVMAVEAMTNKLVTSNVSNIVGNALMQWSGFRGISDQSGRALTADDQPARFINMIWPLLTLAGAVKQVMWFVLRALWKPPEDPERMEQELIERRALAIRLKKEAQPEEAGGGRSS